MTRFIDEYLPDCALSYGARSGPEFSTALVSVDNGGESANQRWSNALFKFLIPEAIRDMQTAFEVRDHFMVMRGMGQTFPFRDPMDFASVDPDNPGTEPTISATDQVIATGNGTKTSFQLVKRYQAGSTSVTRNIIHPVVSSVVVAKNGTPAASGWSVSRTTGVLTFDTAPGNGVVITAGYYFDVEVRYNHDDFMAISASYQAGGFDNLELVQVRAC